MIRRGHYILENGEITEVDLMTWARWLETDKDFSKRRVSQTYIGNVHVSTVFLGLDHSFGHGAPLLFETMIFGGEHDEFCMRYSTLEEAMRGHEKVVEMVNTPPASPAG